MKSKDEIQLLLDLTFLDHEKIIIERQNSLRMTKSESRKWPDQAGLIYWIDRSNSTFVFRALSSENIESDIKLIESNPENFPTLKIKDYGKFMNEVEFFEVVNLWEAQFIESTLANRRLFKEEEFYYNLSDTGYYWWLDGSTENTITLHTSITKIRNTKNLIRLGPIGVIDQNKLKEVFCVEVLEKLFPVVAFSFTSGSISIQSSGDSTFFKLFYNLITHGKTDPLFWQFTNELIQGDQNLGKTKVKSLRDFFKRYAIIRRFWNKVENKL
ncbi:hypothetical protein N9N67_11330 [Bacteriovoracaceae bacterium]|nr:hypothetical protein [Bacteriovoracaceae bacterium]